MIFDFELKDFNRVIIYNWNSPKQFFRYSKMNVTRKNFNQLLPEIREQIKAADFVALDLEFTGLPDDKEKVQKFESSI